MMKRVFLALFAAICLLSVQQVRAQARVAYVDTEYILDQMMDYRSAQKQLDEMADSWRKDVQKQQDDIDRLYKEYQAQYPLLPEADKKKREEEITKREKSLSDFKKEKFGPEGELFKKRQQLIKPIQDKVFDAIQKLAKESAIDIILDKSGATTMLYTNPKYDRSDDVLEILGIAKKN